MDSISHYAVGMNTEIFAIIHVRSNFLTLLVKELSSGTLKIFSKSMYFFPAAAMVMLFIMFVTLAVQPYKEQFKVYGLIDSFMLLVLASIYIMFTAGDVANLKAQNFSTGTRFVAGILGVIPFIYFISLSIWWISMKTKLKQRLPCFQTVELPQPEEQSETDELPDRIEHPSNYQAAPLLPIQ